VDNGGEARLWASSQNFAHDAQALEVIANCHDTNGIWKVLENYLCLGQVAQPFYPGQRFARAAAVSQHSHDDATDVT